MNGATFGMMPMGGMGATAPTMGQRVEALARAGQNLPSDVASQGQAAIESWIQDRELWLRSHANIAEEATDPYTYIPNVPEIPRWVWYAAGAGALLLVAGAVGGGRRKNPSGVKASYKRKGLSVSGEVVLADQVALAATVFGMIGTLLPEISTTLVGIPMMATGLGYFGAKWADPKLAFKAARAIQPSLRASDEPEGEESCGLISRYILRTC